MSPDDLTEARLGMRGGRTLLLGALAIIALALGFYGPALPHQSLALDEAQRVQSDLPAETAWLLRAPGLPFAPALDFSRQQDQTVWGDTPFGRRLHAVLMHVATAVLLFLALTSLGRRAWPAWWAAALFAVNPISQAAVFWTGSRDLALGSGFATTSLVFYLWHARKPGLLRGALWTVPAALASLAHPALAVLPLALRGLDVWPLRRTGRLWSEKLPALAAGTLALVLNVQGRSDLEAPWSLVLDQPWRWARAAYAPSLLLAAALALLLVRPAGPRRLPAQAGALLLLAAALVFTAWGLPAWRSDDALWNALLRRSPGHATAHLALGHAAVARGAPAAAERHYAALGERRTAWANAYARARQWETAVRLAPGDPALRRNLADDGLARGAWDEAFSNYVAVLRQQPRDAAALNGLGEVLLQRGQPGDAIDLFREALALQPDLPRARENLARATALQAGN